MKKKNKKMNMKLILLTLALFAAAFFSYRGWSTVRILIRMVLESEITYFIAWAVPILIFLVNFVGNKIKDIDSEPMITMRFGKFCDHALGGVAYAIVIVTALVLLKGLFIQTFFGDKIFFVDFKNIDLLTILSIALFLLYSAIRKIIEIAKSTFIIGHTAIVLDEKKKEVKYNG